MSLAASMASQAAQLRARTQAPSAAAARTVRVDGLQRPFTAAALSAMLAAEAGAGEPEPEIFLNDVKTLAYATFASEAAAARACAALQGRRWPAPAGG